LPLTTVDLQMMGSRFLRLDSQTIMKVSSTASALMGLEIIDYLIGRRGSVHQRFYQLSTYRNRSV
jgi:hypothetical protein